MVRKPPPKRSWQPSASRFSPPGEGYVSTKQATDELGITYRQLNYWTHDLGLVQTTRAGSGGRQGTSIWFSPDEYVKLEIIAQLSEYGFRLDAIEAWTPHERVQVRDAVREVLTDERLTAAVG